MPYPPHPPDPAPVDLPAETGGGTAAAAPEEAVDGEALRGAMRRIAAPVVVVTTEAGGEPRGATIGSFTSVSLGPPLVSFNVTRGTTLHGALCQADRFAVHLLGAEHAALAAHFALPDLPGEAQFAPFPHRRFADGHPPLLEGTLGVLVCRAESRFAAGDHSIFVGRVEAVLPGRDGAPLLYHRQAYRGVGEEV
jgi:flavin reductase (DIM6/NTAB) family NADH-FMN oxidoreductase RutF